MTQRPRSIAAPWGFVAAALVCLLIVVVLGAIAPARAVVGGPAIGVAVHVTEDFGDIGADPNARATLDAVLDKMSAAGAGWIRMDFRWAEIEQPAKGTTNAQYLARVDAGLQDAHARGLKVLAILVCTPQWATAGAVCVDKPTAPQDYQDFAQWAAQRYSSPTTSANLRIDAWELWNEPDLPAFWEPGGTEAQRPVDYVNSILTPGYAGLKAGSGATNVPVLVGAPSSNDARMVTDPSTQQRVPSTDPRYWLNAVYANGGHGHFDTMATHAYVQVNDAANLEPEYSGDPGWTELSIVNAADVRELMAYYGDAAVRLWFTEFGWSAHTNECLNAPGCVTENWNLGVSANQQGDYIVRAIELVLAHPEWLVDTMVVYGERNKGFTTLDPNTQRHQNNFGLLERVAYPAPQVPKPAYDALLRYLRPCTIVVTVPGVTTRGTSSADVICGTAGSDTIFGGGGDDIIRGYGGNDSLDGQNGNDDIWAGAGSDAVTGSKGADHLYGGDGADTFDASDGSSTDTVSGGWPKTGDVCSAVDSGDVVWSCP